MIQNFFVMPRLLKILTLASFFSLVWVASSIFNGVDFFGRYINVLAWWKSGAGFVSLICAIFFALSAILMLCRLKYGRQIHIMAWLAITAGIYFSFELTNSEFPMLAAAVGFNFGVTICIALYLSFSKDVQIYFKDSLDKNV